jgi:hypothetical protein
MSKGPNANILTPWLEPVPCDGQQCRCHKRANKAEAAVLEEAKATDYYRRGMDTWCLKAYEAETKLANLQKWVKGAEDNPAVFGRAEAAEDLGKCIAAALLEAHAALELEYGPAPRSERVSALSAARARGWLK